MNCGTLNNVHIYLSAADKTDRLYTSLFLCFTKILLHILFIHSNFLIVIQLDQHEHEEFLNEKKNQFSHNRQKGCTLFIKYLSSIFL